MTPEQAGRATPYEIHARAIGYTRRLHNRKLLIGSLLTVPIINGGSRAPKRPITAKKLFPEAFKNAATKQDMERAISLVKRAERGDFDGKS